MLLGGIKMKVEINYYAWLREKIGEKEMLEVEEGSTIEKIVKRLMEKHVSLKEEHFIVVLNGRVVDWNTSLMNGDVISLLPPAGGG
ncbi:MAG: MoaD/ThiS family protein [Thermoproteota archaeon]